MIPRCALDGVAAGAVAAVGAAVAAVVGAALAAAAAVGVAVAVAAAVGVAVVAVAVGDAHSTLICHYKQGMCGGFFRTSPQLAVDLVVVSSMVLRKR